MKFDRPLRPATDTSRVFSYGGKTIPIYPIFMILYTSAYFELDKRHVIKNEKVALDRLTYILYY